MKLVKLTDLKGRAFYVNPECVVSIRLPLAQEAADGAKTAINLYGVIQFVKEEQTVVVGALTGVASS